MAARGSLNVEEVVVNDGSIDDTATLLAGRTLRKFSKSTFATD